MWWDTDKKWRSSCASNAIWHARSAVLLEPELTSARHKGHACVTFFFLSPSKQPPQYACPHGSSTGATTGPTQITHVSFAGRPPAARAAAVASRARVARFASAATAAWHARLCRCQSLRWHLRSQ